MNCWVHKIPNDDVLFQVRYLARKVWPCGYGGRFQCKGSFVFDPRPSKILDAYKIILVNILAGTRYDWHMIGTGGLSVGDIVSE